MGKAKISISLDVEVILWVDKQVEDGNFKNRSRGIQDCIKERMKGEQGINHDRGH